MSRKRWKARRETLCREKLTTPNSCTTELGVNRPRRTEPGLSTGFEPTKARRRKLAEGLISEKSRGDWKPQALPVQ
jgi:hypothetical protein